MLNRIIFLSFFVLYFSQLYAIEYYCPKLPINLTVGEKTNDSWSVWPDNEKITTYKIYYYKIFKKSYYFEHWNAFPHGDNKGSFKGPKYYIGCCGWLKDEKKLICAYKDVEEKKCSEKIIGVKRKYFTCNNNE